MCHPKFQWVHTRVPVLSHARWVLSGCYCDSPTSRNMSATSGKKHDAWKHETFWVQSVNTSVSLPWGCDFRINTRFLPGEGLFFFTFCISFSNLTLQLLSGSADEEGWLCLCKILTFYAQKCLLGLWPWWPTDFPPRRLGEMSSPDKTDRVKWKYTIYSSCLYLKSLFCLFPLYSKSKRVWPARLSVLTWVKLDVFLQCGGEVGE